VVALRIRVSAPNNKEVDQTVVASIEKDLEKIARRLVEQREEPVADIRVQNGGAPSQKHHVTLELRYGKNHLIAKADSSDIGMAVREARDDVIRQMNDRKTRGSHSSIANRR
jgi:ribosome-associated translation inhibitor RaiA